MNYFFILPNSLWGGGKIDKITKNWKDNNSKNYIIYRDEG